MHAEAIPHPPSLEACRSRRQVAGWAVVHAAREVPCDVVTCDEINLGARWMFGINNARSPGAEDLFPVLLDLAGEHPVLDRFAAGHTHQALRMTDVIRPATFERTELYRRFYSVFGIRHQLIAPVDVGPRRFVALALFRQRLPFTDANLRRLNSLVPALQVAWRSAVQLEETQRDAFQQLGYHIVPLSPGFGGPPVPPPLQDLLARHWGTLQWERTLDSWMQTIRNSRPSPDDTPVVWEAEGGLELRSIRLTDDEQALALRPTAARTHRRSSAWNRLSPREQGVAEWLVEGKTSAVVARLLGVTEATVRKHLEHIYAKLGVENRASAIRVLID